MKTWKPIISILVLLPFILSVSGVLVIQSHCNCTGSNKTTIYIAPETCASLEEEHQHLFREHADDLMACCNEESNQPCESQNHSDHCGCDNPDARFYQNTEQFTDQKTITINLLPVFADSVIDIYGNENVEDQLSVNKVDWLKNPPPLIVRLDNYIHFICKTKIPEIA
ncbi:MAG TPA: hypothetical protein DCY35_10720 [Prolixibacteraceae bacterium]|nr:hypothetical protein [Prolixibacteraceae bacterium]